MYSSMCHTEEQKHREFNKILCPCLALVFCCNWLTISVTLACPDMCRKQHICYS